VLRIGLAALVMGLGVYWFAELTPGIHTLVRGTGAIALGGVLYVAMSLLLRSEEVSVLRKTLLPH
jgi:hypothetical protein